mgnify:CR=1 FL=1
MFSVSYCNTITGAMVYRNYKHMEIQQVRKLSDNYAKKNKLQVITITKVY